MRVGPQKRLYAPSPQGLGQHTILWKAPSNYNRSGCGQALDGRCCCHCCRPLQVTYCQIHLQGHVAAALYPLFNRHHLQMHACRIAQKRVARCCKATMSSPLKPKSPPVGRHVRLCSSLHAYLGCTRECSHEGSMTAVGNINMK